jgi:hypothetical protein
MWHLVFVQFLYNAATILLYRPALMDLLRTSTSHPNLFSSPAFTNSLTAADKINELIEKTLRYNPNFSFINNFVNFCIFQGAFVYLLKAKVDSRTSPSTSLPQPPQDNYCSNIPNRERNVKLHIEALDKLAQVWQVSGALRDLLLKLSSSLSDEWDLSDDKFVYAPL